MKKTAFPNIQIIEPGDFEPSQCYYPRVLNATIHPLVEYFFHLTNEQILERYTRLHPTAHKDSLWKILNYQPQYFFLAGSDLMLVSNSGKEKHLTLIETNSCPSGQKSMPTIDPYSEQGSYRRFIESTFYPLIQGGENNGGLAVLYDKNPMENFGYAAAMADFFQEPVYLACLSNGSSSTEVFFQNNQLHILIENSQSIPIRACFRYVTQDPWNQIPLESKTKIVNPIHACLAGGRNKEQAYYAYQSFNEKFQDLGLSIHTPYTLPHVRLDELEKCYQKWNGNFVIKLPHSNAGQGVFIVTSKKEWEEVFQNLQETNQEFVLAQELVHSEFKPELGNHLFHIGTVPDSKNRIFAYDIRMLVHSTPNGLRPLAGYSRISRFPLNSPLLEHVSSWDIYGTNLSIKSDQGWEYDDSRLLVFDRKNFGKLGIGLDELVEAFVITCMALFAIDRRAVQIYSTN